MASTRASCILPMIKCSNCNIDIEISSLGEHVCSQAPSTRQTPAGRFNDAYASTNTIGEKDFLSRATRKTPARIDPSTANRSFAAPANEGGEDPFHESLDRNGALYHLPPRSATYPPQPRGPSPELSLAQDCAFPVFPPGQNHFSKDVAESRSSNGESPSSSRGNGQLLQRMNSITPGPFAQKFNGKEQAYRRPHQWTATQESRGLAIPSSPESSRAAMRPLISGTDSTMQTSLITLSRGMTSDWEQEKPAESTRKKDTRFLGSVPLQNPFISDHRPKTPPSISNDETAFGLSPPRIRRESSPHSRTTSITRPLHEIGSMNSYKSRYSHVRREGETSPTKEVLRSASAGGSRSERESSDTSTLTSATYSGSNQSRSASATGHRYDRQQHEIPPLPVAASLIKDAQINSARNAVAGHNSEERRKFEPLHDMKQSWGPDFDGSPFHTSTKSVSSTGSSNSDHHTASSRSSPPLSGHLFGFKLQASEGHHTNPLLNDIHETTAHDASGTTRRGGRTKSFSRPTYSTRDGKEPMPTSLQEPALNGSQYGSRRPSMDERESSRPISIFQNPSLHQPSSHLTQLPSRSYDSALSVPRPPLPDPSRRRPAVGHKGNCRGCGEIIIGKSVSSADGRLTGRYHKQCFVCTTCHEAFPSNDFYVIDNSPLCARHYHQQNGTMCSTCDRGIEGQYLETESKQKFHSHCFACRECHLILRDDYYESTDGAYLCERHALRPDNLGPGRRHPERRTTRLMMM